MTVAKSWSRPVEQPQFCSHQMMRITHAGWVVYAVAGLVGLVVFGTGILLDWWLLPGRRQVLYSDGFTAAIAALLAYFALRSYDKRQRELSLRLAIIGDVNHHVRNAITTIMLNVYLKDDAELRQITDAAVKRIDWVLRDVLPRDLKIR